MANQGSSETPVWGTDNREFMLRLRILCLKQTDNVKDHHLLLEEAVSIVARKVRFTVCVLIREIPDMPLNLALNLFIVNVYIIKVVNSLKSEMIFVSIKNITVIKISVSMLSLSCSIKNIFLFMFCPFSHFPPSACRKVQMNSTEQRTGRMDGREIFTFGIQHKRAEGMCLACWICNPPLQPPPLYWPISPMKSSVQPEQLAWWLGSCGVKTNETRMNFWDSILNMQIIFSKQ